jgi:hypothetical protein
MRTAAGLTVVKYDGEAENASRDGDVVVWSALKGLYGGVALGATNIAVDKDSNAGYYHHTFTPRQITAGSARLSYAQPLHAALAGVKLARGDTTQGQEKAKPDTQPKPDGKAPVK